MVGTLISTIEYSVQPSQRNGTGRWTAAWYIMLPKYLMEMLWRCTE